MNIIGTFSRLTQTFLTTVSFYI